ncbi:MAG: NAD-dependent epimerase/dehydratase family protein [Lautropia sp.]|nr:NAD-dependent epimerase/dehydratase family protein [Lautropia sp.]
MKVLLTGATGFVGLNIVEALLEAGHDVVSYQRQGARRRYLDLLGPVVVEGELDDVRQLRHAMQDVDAVIHTAGMTSCRQKDWPALQRCNVQGTAAVLEAARQCKVGRLVFTSTTSTIGSTGRQGEAADENTPLRGWRASSPYARSKQEAERTLLAQDDVPVVILNLAEVVGAWDHTLQWGRIVLAVARDQLPFIPPGSATYCSGRDAARAHVQALVLGRSGERYIIGRDCMAISSFVALVGQRLGAEPRPRSRLPWRWQRLDSGLRQWACEHRLAGISPPAVEPYRMRVFGTHHLFSDDKARRELGYHCQGITHAIDDCFHWYRQHGFLDGLPSPPLLS